MGAGRSGWEWQLWIGPSRTRVMGNGMAVVGALGWMGPFGQARPGSFGCGGLGWKVLDWLGSRSKGVDRVGLVLTGMAVVERVE